MLLNKLTLACLAFSALLLSASATTTTFEATLIANEDADSDSGYTRSDFFADTNAYKQVYKCPALPPRSSPANNINDLRVDDVRVVMALGDSLSAGFGVKGLRVNPLADVSENRGLSWIMGGDKGAGTVANFIARFQPNLVGRSLKDHFAEICYGPLCPPLQYKPDKDVFNAAQSGALVSNLDHELRYLVKQVKANKNVKFSSDWKLMNIAIGPNDLCLACLDAGNLFLSPDQFEKNLRSVVQNAYNELPRTIVTLTELFNVSQVFDLSLRSPYCKNIHRVLPIECSCAFNETPIGARTRQKMDNYAQEYNVRMRKIAAEYQKLNLYDFAVVTQPQFSEADASEFPVGFLSTVDCFHIAELGTEAMAVAHFNNLFRPQSEKAVSFSIGDPIICPTADSRITTRNN